jgi:hypothetical protein
MMPMRVESIEPSTLTQNLIQVEHMCTICTKRIILWALIGLCSRLSKSVMQVTIPPLQVGSSIS